jgi:hypothetical protein
VLNKRVHGRMKYRPRLLQSGDGRVNSRYITLVLAHAIGPRTSSHNCHDHLLPGLGNQAELEQ